MIASSRVLNGAFAHARRGWPVFPCAGKRPHTHRGLHDAGTDPATIAA